jgi:hypothetical protein
MSTLRGIPVRAASRIVVIGAAACCCAALYAGTAAAELPSSPPSGPSSCPSWAPIAPIPGTSSGCGYATSWDASGRPTHVVYLGTVPSPTTSVPFGGNSPFYDGYGRPMVPSLPAPASGAVVGGVVLPPPAQSDPTHVTLPYIPAQIPHVVPPPNPLEYPSNAAQRQASAQQGQIKNDQANGTFATAAEMGYANGTYSVNGKTFPDRGSAIFEKNHPSP